MATDNVQRPCVGSIRVRPIAGENTLRVDWKPELAISMVDYYHVQLVVMGGATEN